MRGHVFEQIGDLFVTRPAVEIFDDRLSHIIVAPTGAGEAEYLLVARPHKPGLGVEFYLMYAVVRRTFAAIGIAGSYATK